MPRPGRPPVADERGCPRMVRLLLDDDALAPVQLKDTFEFVPNGFAVMLLLPDTAERPTVAIPHVPLHE